MPSKDSRYVNLSIRRELRKTLEEIGVRHGFVSLNDVIAFLIHVYHQHELLVRMIRRNHTDTSSTHTDIQGIGTSSISTYTDTRGTYTRSISTGTDREGIHTGYISMDTGDKASSSPRDRIVRRDEKTKRKKSMRDIIAERKVQLLSEVKPRDPEAFLGKAEKLGIVVLRGEKDAVLVDPGFWEEFREEVLPRLPCNPDEWSSISGSVRKLAEFLLDNGLMYCSRDNGWILL